MPVKSIIDIDVNDAKFEKFREAFNKYQLALTKQSEMWAKSGKSQTQIANHWQQLTSKMMAQQNGQKGDLGEAGKKQLTNLRQSDSLWTSMSRNTKDVAKNIVGATTSLLRWTGILSAVTGLFGAGGLYGIDRMAAGVSDRRQSAMGRGLSVGAQSAFNTNFARIFGGNADPFLSNVNEMMSDPRKSWSLATLGVNNSGKTEDVAVNLLQAMRQRARGTDDRNLGMLDTQTGVGAGTQVWRTLHDMKDSEFSQLLASNQRDVKGLGVNDGTAKAWQDFTTQMSRAGQQIDNVFVKGLVALSGPLSHLSSAAIGLVETIMGSQGLKDGIKSLAGWIDEFAKTIQTGEFNKKVKGFIDDVGGLADAVKKIVHPSTWYENIFKNLSLPGADFKGAYERNRLIGTPFEGMDPGVAGGGPTSPRKLWAALSQDQPIGFPEGTVSRFAGMDPQVLGGPDVGYQKTRDTVARQLEALKFHYRQWTDTDETPAIAKAMAAYSMGQQQFDTVLAAHPNDWQKNIPASAQQMVLTINNNTGGSAIAVLNANAQ